NVAGNAISGGIDLSGLFPQYINIRRGAYITAAVGLAINPWQLLNTPNTFIQVLSGFGVFLGPMTGLMVIDYWVIRGRRIRLSHLYIPNKTSSYWYTYGVNWRAVIAWPLGVFPLMRKRSTLKISRDTSYINCEAGFVQSVSSGKLLFLTDGTIVAKSLGTIYYILNKCFPMPGLHEVDEYDYYGTVAGVHLPEGPPPLPPASLSTPFPHKSPDSPDMEKEDYSAAVYPYVTPR
ncbi:MAG: hypothetical protein CYPHOPRED_002088, partial [Cyphobasidiales sp. Tagirdzhanova-0007]